MTKPLRIPLGPQIYSQFLSCMTDFFLSQARRWAGRVVDLKLSKLTVCHKPKPFMCAFEHSLINSGCVGHAILNNIRLCSLYFHIFERFVNFYHYIHCFPPLSHLWLIYVLLNGYIELFRLNFSTFALRFAQTQRAWQAIFRNTKFLCPRACIL
jgi:hypothetical protein